MIVEHRTYTLHPGKMAAYFGYYTSEGMAVQLQYQTRPLGYYTTELGALNQVIHLWAYEDLNERMRARERLKQDPRWAVYVQKITPLIQQQESKILVPAPFFTPAPTRYASAIPDAMTHASTRK